MSAFQVSPQHIGAIVRWYCNTPHPYQAYRLDEDDAPALMADLAAECFRSVRYRYPTGPLPGPDGAQDQPVTCDPDVNQYRQLTAIEVIKAIDCLEYQSCEHPEWTTSAARQTLAQIRSLAIGTLPGYADAPWCID